MKGKKILALVLATITVCCFSSCEQAEETTQVNTAEMNEKAPDYGAYTDQFDFYGYSGPSNGTWKVNGETQTAGQDFRTVERFKEYKDAGMTIWLPQSSARITRNFGGSAKPGYVNPKDESDVWDEDVWTERETEWQSIKTYWDNAYEAGLEKIIITDVQIQQWSNVYLGMLIGEGEGYTFESEAELDATLEKMLEPYINHEAFYGIMLFDEPSYAAVQSYGQMYRALKRVAKDKYDKDIFVQHNLLPMREYGQGAYSMMPLLEWFDEKEDTVSQKEYYDLVGGVTADQETTPQEQLALIQEAELAAYNNDKTEVACQKYAKYIEAYIDSMGSDYIQYDDYPMRGTEKESSVLKQYIRNLQLVADIAKEKGVKFYNVTQTYATENPSLGTTMHAVCDEKDARWLNNMILGFGVKQIVYFTYWAKGDDTDTYKHIDAGSFMTKYGEKTDLYFIMQQIMKENQTFAPTILQFEYQGSCSYTVKPTNFSSTHVGWVNNDYQFQKLQSVDVNKEIALITELYDDDNARYMYMVQNIIDPVNKGSKAFQTTELTFAKGYQYAAVYRNGERTLEPLKNGKLVVKNAPGEAAFIIPY